MMEKKISEEQLATWLEKNWKGNKTCAICKQNSWIIGNQVFELREFRGGGLIIGGKSSVFPVIPITCSICGYVLLFNVVVSGMIESENLDEQEKEGATDVSGQEEVK